MGVGLDNVFLLAMSRIQALIFDRQYYRTPEQAKKKAIKMGFHPGRTEVMANTIRVQQKPSSEFQEFRVKRLTPTIQATIGIKEKK